ncbi:unnamed protein product [Trifolium pratense]|uniref:Uncharacterized protein n=1 Tax=Trifolium pratense TaxID=57577 RepID=A0ACB0K8E7_TRIPR|nr:unnamed protein product [Trifolium pratense]
MATDLQSQLITAFQQSWPNLASAIRGHQFPADSNPVPLLSSIASTTDTPEKKMFCSLLGCFDVKFGEMKTQLESFNSKNSKSASELKPVYWDMSNLKSKLSHANIERSSDIDKIAKLNDKVSTLQAGYNRLQVTHNTNSTKNSEANDGSASKARRTRSDREKFSGTQKETENRQMVYESWKVQIQQILLVDGNCFPSSFHIISYITSHLSGKAWLAVQDGARIMNSYPSDPQKWPWRTSIDLWQTLDRRYILLDGTQTAKNTLDTLFQGKSAYGDFKADFDHLAEMAKYDDRTKVDMLRKRLNKRITGVIDNQVDAFSKFKSSFTQAPILAYFDYHKHTIVETDASNWASGGAFLQKGDDGIIHPVAFFSSKHSPVESNYEIYDKELLAIIKALEEWRPELAGVQKPFESITEGKRYAEKIQRDFYCPTISLNSLFTYCLHYLRFTPFNAHHLLSHLSTLTTMNSLAAPPALAYRSLEEAKEAVFSHALSEGYALVVLHTRRVGNKKEGAIKALILNYSRGRRTRKEQNPDKKRVRVGTIKATGCLCAASIRLEDELWQVEVDNEEHNHELYVHESAHPQGRRLTEEQNAGVLTLGRAGVTPGCIITSLRQNDGIISTAHDVYNIRIAERNRMLAGRTPLTALLDSLANETLYYTQHDAEQKLTHLLIISLFAEEIC